MFNSGQILEQLLSIATQPSARQQSSGLGGLLNNNRGSQNSPLGGVLGSALGGLLNSGGSSQQLGGGLLGALLQGNKSSGGGNGAAILGGMAMNAFRMWQESSKQSANVQASNFAQQPQQFALDFNAMPSAQQENSNRAMLSAVIAAAKADGVIDAREQQLICEKLQEGASAEAVAWVQAEISKPLDVASIAALANSPEMAAKIYLASLVIIDDQNADEKKYLDALAGKLKLDPQLRKVIEQQWAQTRG